MEYLMGRRILTILTLISAALLAGSVLLFLAGCFLNPWDHYVSLTGSFHTGVWTQHGFDSRMVFFNDLEYGPYRGSIVNVVAPGGVHSPWIHDEGFGDSWGIYYRSYEWADSTLWTLMVSLWYPVAFFAVLPVLWLLRRWLRRQRSFKSDETPC